MDAPPPGRRRPTARHLAELIGDAISPALSAKGFAGREVVSFWAGFVGERLARRSRPLKIDWPKRRPGAEGEAAEPAVLVVLVESAFAPELQHMAPVLLARINAHLGWAAVGRLALRQGPVDADRPAPRPAAPPPTPAMREAAAAAAAPIVEPALRDAVTRLGVAVARRRQPR